MELMLIVWAAEVLPAFFATLMSISIVTLVVSCVTWIFLLIDGTPDNYSRQYDRPAYDLKIEQYKKMKKVVPWMVGVAASVVVFCQLVPHKSSSIYLMAGAYATQTAVTSESGKKIMKMIENKIEDALQETEKDIKKVDNKTSTK